MTSEPSPGGLLAIGRVSRAHGLKGELRVELFFDGSDALAKFRSNRSTGLLMALACAVVGTAGL